MNQLQLLIQSMSNSGVSIIHQGSTKSSMPDGTPYLMIKIQDIGRYFNIANPTKVFNDLAYVSDKAKFIEEVKSDIGRPAMYVAEPLFYRWLLNKNNKSEEAKMIRSWVFEQVLVNI
jgi:prophage antirepressor-like protein